MQFTVSSKRRIHINATQVLKSQQEGRFSAINIIALCREGKLKEAIAISRQESAEVNTAVFASLLQACGKIKGLKQGKYVHTHIIKVGWRPDTFLWNNVLNMYAKCGDLKDARRVFDKMPQRSIISWTSMINAYSQGRKAGEALNIFEQMQHEGIEPNHYTYSSIIKACASLGQKALDRGRYVHDLILRTGFELDVVVMNALVDMYAKCGSIWDARQVFDKMSERNVVSWNSMIVGYCQKGNVGEAMKLFSQMPELDMFSLNTMIAGLAQNGFEDEALKFYVQMQEMGMKPDKFTFSSVLRACTSLAALEHGKQIHGHIILTGLESDITGVTALVDMYAKCTNLENAQKLFSKLSNQSLVSKREPTAICDSRHPYEAMEFDSGRTKPNIVSWNAMVAGYSQNGCGDKALNLFYQMQQENLEPDHFTFGSVLRACGSVFDVEKGKQIHNYIIKTGYEADIIVGSALVDMYAKCKIMADACKVFDVLFERDTITWTIIIVGCAQHGWNKVALQYFGEMLRRGVKSDQFTVASALSACANLAALEQGKQVHTHLIVSGFESNITAGSALIDMYTKCGSMTDAHIAIDEINSQNSVLQPIMVAGNSQRGQGDVVVGSALVDMYSKCGDLENAYKIFGKLRERDVVSWTSMIGGLAQHGRGMEALQLFQQMLQAGLKPNAITFVGVLSACSHSGLVDEGLHYFDIMSKEYGITPRKEHYSCLVDLLGRAGCLQEAHDFINRMPVEADASIWSNFLGACRVHGNMDLGKHAAECLLEMKEHDASTYVVLANIYAAVGRWDDAAKIRSMMQERGIKKKPGYSWIEIKNKIHTFVVGDMAHPQNEEIHSNLDSIAVQINQTQFIPSSNLFWYGVED
ncbi:pentatricopeptide repeat-containing protein At2g13600 [Cryptomeria japonica]|uniref:pentatricopeptide repeat-containing protein At2g13600 n=1 Tax=Cryptomeria japonica TaxID=3369 RepID=UPI0027D9F462|nr:pentatricopeptide repeat-containing protein At2g13600 [Cryptomeria japonica]